MLLDGKKCNNDPKQLKAALASSMFSYLIVKNFELADGELDNVSNVRFVNCSFKNMKSAEYSNFTNVTFERSVFQNCDFSTVYFNSVFMKDYTQFSNCDFSRSAFSDTKTDDTVIFFQNNMTDSIMFNIPVESFPFKNCKGTETTRSIEFHAYPNKIANTQFVSPSDLKKIDNNVVTLFSHCTFNSLPMQDINLKNACFSHCYFEKCDFSNKDISDFLAVQSVFRKCNFDMTKGKNIFFEGVLLDENTFKGAEINVSFLKSTAYKMGLHEANLSGQILNTSLMLTQADRTTKRKELYVYHPDKERIEKELGGKFNGKTFMSVLQFNKQDKEVLSEMAHRFLNKNDRELMEHQDEMTDYQKVQIMGKLVSAVSRYKSNPPFLIEGKRNDINMKFKVNEKTFKRKVGSTKKPATLEKPLISTRKTRKNEK